MLIWRMQVILLNILQGQRNGFQSGRGPWNTEKYCRPPWLADKRNFRILDALEWLKQ